MSGFSNLVLLVGTNPLPNYVVAKYFLKNNQKLKRIWLVHSEKRDDIRQKGTKWLADNIKEVLTNEFQGKAKFNYCVLRNVSSAKEIENNIKEKLMQKLGNESSVHLNYTGGTKVMSVHIHRVLKEKLKDKIFFSYLDARTFCLKDDEKGTITGDLRKEIDISLENLMKLHGYERDKFSVNDWERWRKTLKAFKKLIDNNRLQNCLDWKNNTLRKIFYPSDKFLIWSDFKNSQQEVFKNSLTDKDILDLLSTIPEENRFFDDKWEIIKIDNKKEYKKRCKETIKDFLDGKWLEGYVYMVLKQKIEEVFPGRNIPLETNWYIKKIDSKKTFELDVILISGYQICGVSCTTSKKESLCKSKGFEVFHRANQIGGEEAKAVLVTCLPREKTGKIDDDLKTITGSDDKKLLVLGIEDLKEDILWKKIKGICLEGLRGIL